jgi:hypothetical protein
MSDRSPATSRLPVTRLVLLALLVLVGVALFFLLAPRTNPILVPGSGGTRP